MKQISILIVIFFIVFAMSCKKSSEIRTPEGLGSNSGTTQSAPASSQSSTIAPGMNPSHGQPGHQGDIAVGAPIDSAAGKQSAPPSASQQKVPAQTTISTTASGMNPPHGQPGHRCDIPVGAPLDSPPRKQPTTAPGMNPPHGQPGHRCDIPVGAPLDSPPAKQQAPTTTGGK